MKVCDKCNTQNNDNARFCAVCGNALDGAQNTPKYTNSVHSLPVSITTTRMALCYVLWNYIICCGCFGICILKKEVLKN